MDINKLIIFLRAADNGSFIKTAQEMQYTPSGITKMMNNLEEELGFPLFTRTNKGICITDNASRILPIIRQLVGANEQLTQECSLINNVICGNVKVAAFSSIAIQWIPIILEKFKHDSPNVHVEIVEESDSAIMKGWIADGFVDLCIFSLEEEYPFDMINLMDDPMVVILPKNHPLTRFQALSLDQLSGESFLIAKTGSGLDKDVMQILSKAKYIPNIDCTSNLDYSIIAMVAHGLGVSIMPLLMIKDHLSDVAVRPFAPAVTRRLGIATRSFQQLSPAAKLFIKYSKSTVRELVGIQ